MQDLTGSSQAIRQERICQAQENGFICGSANERGSTSYLPEIYWRAAAQEFNWQWLRVLMRTTKGGSVS